MCPKLGRLNNPEQPLSVDAIAQLEELLTVRLMFNVNTRLYSPLK